jgi:uncharacterized protein YgiM (DUF1202 family)
MRKFLILGSLLLTLVMAVPALAQADDAPSCDADEINTRIDGTIQAYQRLRAEEDGQATLSAVRRLDQLLDDVLAECGLDSETTSVQVIANLHLNVRGGPGRGYGITDNMAASTSADAIGRNAAGTWVQIADGWVYARLVTVEGDLESLPVTWEG